MKSMQIRRKNESGQSLVEYGLILGLIAVAAIAILVTLGPQISGVFSNVSTEISDVPGGTPAAE
ncbi:MAG: Flp family type IVb pilin [Verrucomicrobiota bacterium]|nr:Flp family type IVb pilin [Verrucomicrobiota bacterium]